MEFLSNLFWLLVAHAVADYAFQSDFIAKHKNPNGSDYDKAKYGPWWWTMLAHSLINGGLVALVLPSRFFLLGVLETIFHFTSDTQKCRGYMTTGEDQTLHIACKVAWAAIATLL